MAKPWRCIDSPRLPTSRLQLEGTACVTAGSSLEVRLQPAKCKDAVRGRMRRRVAAQAVGGGGVEAGRQLGASALGRRSMERGAEAGERERVERRHGEIYLMGGERSGWLRELYRTWRQWASWAEIVWS